MTRPLAIPTYTTGTVAVSSAGEVTGTGTNFLSPDGSANWTVAVGDIFFCGNNFAIIESVNSATDLTLAGWNGGNIAAGSSFTIFRYSGLPNTAVVGLVQALLALGTTSSPFQALSALVGTGKINFTTDVSGNILLQVRAQSAAGGDAAFVTALKINPTTGVVIATGLSSPNPPQEFLSGSGFTPGTTTSLTLTNTPLAASAVSVYFNGVRQPSSTWSLSGNVITFGAAIPADINIVAVTQNN